MPKFKLKDKVELTQMSNLYSSYINNWFTIVEVTTDNKYKLKLGSQGDIISHYIFNECELTIKRNTTTKIHNHSKEMAFDEKT